MRPWQIKALTQGALAALPGGVRVNTWLQRLAGGRRDIGAHLRSKVVDDWQVHARLLREFGHVLQDCTLVEIGSGWLPVLPLCFSLAGARRCHSYDLVRLLEVRSFDAVLVALEEQLPLIAEAAGQPLEAVRERYARLRAVGTEGLLSAAGIDYRAPADATMTGLAAGSVDVVFSNSVLEHVDAATLDAMMVECARVLRPGGLASHSVNCGDHYAYFDRGITPLNYLKYSSQEWRRWNNNLLYQNRLRPADFVASAGRGGLRVLAQRWNPRPQLLQRLPEDAIAPEFRHYDRDDLCATSVDIIATPAGA